MLKHFTEKYLRRLASRFGGEFFARPSQGLYAIAVRFVGLTLGYKIGVLKKGEEKI